MNVIRKSSVFLIPFINVLSLLLLHGCTSAFAQGLGDARGCSGSITPLGERQHREIAERMYHNFPQVFREDAFIDARSSTSLRCAMSMSYFTERLKELNPALHVERRAYHRYMDYIAYTSPEVRSFLQRKLHGDVGSGNLKRRTFVPGA